MCTYHKQEHNLDHKDEYDTGQCARGGDGCPLGRKNSVSGRIFIVVYSKAAVHLHLHVMHICDHVNNAPLCSCNFVMELTI